MQGFISCHYHFFSKLSQKDVNYKPHNERLINFLIYLLLNKIKCIITMVKYSIRRHLVNIYGCSISMFPAMGESSGWRTSFLLIAALLS